MYAVIGDNSAPYYFRLGNSLGVPAGRLVLQNDLKTESKETYIVSTCTINTNIYTYVYSLVLFCMVLINLQDNTKSIYNFTSI
jgi:hypothetical protein